MNNKGQTLVIFVLILPILFLTIALVIDLGNLENTKQKCENEIKSTIKYGLKHKEKENIKNHLQHIIDQNIEGQSTITMDEDTITINVKTKQKSIFNNIFKNKYDIDITYVGYIENNKIILIKE